MARLVDACIADEPLLRHIQIMEVVLTHCTSVLWPHNKDKVKNAPRLLIKLRALLISTTKECVHRQRLSLESSASQQSITPHKGQCDLGAGKIDVTASREEKSKVPRAPIALLELPPHQSLHMPPLSEHTPSSVDLHSANQTLHSDIVSPDAMHGTAHAKASTFSRTSTSNSLSRRHYPEVGADNNRVRDAHAGPSPAVAVSVSFSSHHCADECSEGCGGAPSTPATTRHDEVAFASENGLTLSERSNIMKELPLVPLQVRRLSGGITNELFHVYDDEDPSTSVVVRVFGKETDRVISRESELFYQSLFIPTYVYGNNFLVYDFLHGYYTLPYPSMATVATPIARAIAAFQVRATRAAQCDYAPPLLRDSQNIDYWNRVDTEPHTAEGSKTSSRYYAIGDKSRFDRESNYLIGSLTKWVDLVLSDEIVAKVHEDRQESFLKVGHSLQSACAWMVSMLERQRAFLPEGVCHNDLLSANLMIHTVRGDVRVIDFDYTKRNFLLYDVANHFNEYPGLDCDYDMYFPSDSHMFDFIAEYRRGMRDALETAWAESSNSTNSTTAASCECQIFPNARELFWSDSEEAEAQVVGYWTQLAKLLTLASHLSWSVWSLLQEAVSTLDVDFLDYAQVRYNRYLAVRTECSEKL
ncbi:hypothetical protein JKF63_03324 [Porcisia hertigi]|uniref:ethanolamine kinase n=1 Tax=Porcisia hertigi TaxID=2761500 RepID=A0A836ID60_9TRYP|nr:hypothetical protein JKF63_03324 [Porcisia hertigi]